MRLALLVALVALMTAGPALGAVSFAAHRLMQYEHESKSFGSSASGLGMPIADWRGNASLARSVAIFTADEATPAALGNAVHAQKAGAILIILPRQPSSAQHAVRACDVRASAVPPLTCRTRRRALGPCTCVLPAGRAELSRDGAISAARELCHSNLFQL